VAAERDAEGADPALGLGILARFSFRDPPAAIAAAGADAILACGPVGAEVVLFSALARLAPATLRGGVSPGLAAFPALLGGDPEGLLAPVQWHPEIRMSARLTDAGGAGADRGQDGMILGAQVTS
jgi:hypothetical protein